MDIWDTSGFLAGWGAGLFRLLQGYTIHPLVASPGGALYKWVYRAQSHNVGELMRI